MTHGKFYVGETSRIVVVRAVTASTGLPNTTLVYNTSGLVAKYTKNGAAATTITLVTATAGTWTSSGFIARNATAGEYEIHLPNAALATDVVDVTVVLYGVADTFITACTLVGNGIDHAIVGTAQAGAAGTITLPATASATTDFYVGNEIKILAGTGAKQPPRMCTAYNGTTKVATISPNWLVTPDSTSVLVGTPLAPQTTAELTAIANATVEAEITALLTYNRSANTTGTITGPTSGSNALGLSVDAAYDPVKTF